MDRLACVIIPDVALQVAQIRRPDLRMDPVAVLTENGPQAKITHVNGRALALGATPGMRYAAAVALVPRLRAAILAGSEVAAIIEAATRILRSHAPEVEPSAEEPGVFWVNVSGLDGMYGSPERWAEAVRASLAQLGLSATAVVGFSRFGTYATAASSSGTRIFPTPQAESEAALRVPLRRLRLPDEPAARLFQLGVQDVGALLGLPRGGVLRRFGREVHLLHQLAAGDLWIPLRPSFERETARITLALDVPETRADAVLFLMKRELPPLFSKLASRGEAIAALEIHLKLEGACTWQRAQIRPAAPTLDSVQLLDLIRLRLDHMPLDKGIEEIVLVADGTPWAPDALRLLPEHPGRDLAAGGRALARLRAALGETMVVRARLREGHLPEARFAWEPVDQIVQPRPCEVAHPTLVRRIWTRPVSLGRGGHEPAGTFARSFSPMGGLVKRLGGPYIVSGGWWAREVHREYYFAETRNGEVLWVYYDRPRQKWFAQGKVE